MPKVLAIGAKDWTRLCNSVEERLKHTQVNHVDIRSILTNMQEMEIQEFDSISAMTKAIGGNGVEVARYKLSLTLYSAYLTAFRNEKIAKVGKEIPLVQVAQEVAVALALTDRTEERLRTRSRTDVYKVVLKKLDLDEDFVLSNS